MISQPFITGLPAARSFLILFVILSLSGLVLLVSASAGLFRRSWHDDVIRLLNKNFVTPQTLNSFQLPVKARNLECGTSGS